jgi:hypothetical protein
MANTIKLKQGSGSDPSASDLVLGEPAIRTDTGEIFLKKDDGSIAKVAGGIDDGDKGDITVSNDGATFTIDSGVIDNANVASNAAIAGSKISPDFGSQNVATTGTLASGNLTITSTQPFLSLQDSNNENDFEVGNAGGLFRIRDVDAAANRLTISSAGVTTITGNLDCEAGLDVTGDVTVTSTAPKISLIDTNANDDFEIKVNAGNFAINDATNSVNRFLIDSSGTVDIGGNLDVGAGVDVTGNITVSGTVDGRDVATDGSKLDGIESGATADQTASEILTLLKTVDGSGSGLDADTLDGISSGSFVRSDADDTLNGQYTISDSGNEKLILAGSASPYIRFQENTTNKAFIGWSSSGYIRLLNQETSEELRIQNGSNGLKYGVNGTFYNVWHQLNDGSGSGLDADTLDGVQGSSFLRSDTADTASGDITFAGGAGAVTIQANSDIRFANGTWSGNTTTPKIQAHNSALYIVGGASGIYFRENTVNRWQINGDGHFDPQSDSTYDIGQTSSRVRKGYFDEVDSSQVLVGNGILETKAAIATSHTIATDYNALAVSPTINSGVTVTVPSGAVWAIV